jgi:hypothetical protein
LTYINTVLRGTTPLYPGKAERIWAGSEKCPGFYSPGQEPLTVSGLQAALTSIFFAALCASAFFGSVTVNMPLANFASILSASTQKPVQTSRGFARADNIPSAFPPFLPGARL